MADHISKGTDRDPNDLDIEVILQRIFHEKDPVAHKAAIWELFGQTDDWELFERVLEMGGHKSIETYFQNVMNQFDDAADALGLEMDDQREAIREMYANPLISLRSGDWAGTASAMHDILLNEIYEIYPIDEEEMPFGEATAFDLQKWVGEEVLFPLSVLEFMAYSDYLTRGKSPDLDENNLTLMLTLFFIAQAQLDLAEGARGQDIQIFPQDDE
jgi:hypothetical protein